MISWTSILAVTAGVAAGTTMGAILARRRGGPQTLLPIWAFTALTALSAAAAMLFIESASAALDAPSREAVWMMIASAAVCTLSLGTHMTLESRRAMILIQRHRT
jgi:hypothetical protein